MWPHLISFLTFYQKFINLSLQQFFSCYVSITQTIIIKNVTSLTIYSADEIMIKDYFVAFFLSRFCLLYNYWVESFQDFLIELDMQSSMHLLEISIFSLNNVTVRFTKIMNNLLKHLKILIFKVIFQCWKLIESFPKKISLKNFGRGDQLLLKKCL